MYLQEFAMAELMGKLPAHYTWRLPWSVLRSFLHIVGGCTSLAAYARHDVPFSQRQCDFCRSLLARAAPPCTVHHVLCRCTALSHYALDHSYTPAGSPDSGMRAWFQANYSKDGLLYLVGAVDFYMEFTGQSV